MHYDHSIVTSTMTRLATGRNDWKGHDKINSSKPAGKTKQQKRTYKQSRIDFRTCKLCNMRKKMTVEHIMCNCRNEHITNERKHMMKDLKNIFTSMSARTRRPRLDYFFSSSTWVPTQDTKREKPTREEIAKFLERIYRFVRAITTHTGSLYSTYRKRKRRRTA